MGPALSTTSRGPISEASEVESGAHRATQLDRGLSVPAPSQPHQIPSKHFTTAPYHSTAGILVHGMALRPSETNPHKARAALCLDRQLMSFSPFFFFLSSFLVYLVHSMFGCNPPDFENRGMVILTRATLLHMCIMRGGALYCVYAVSPGYQGFRQFPVHHINTGPTSIHRGSAITSSVGQNSSLCHRLCLLMIIASRAGRINHLGRQVCLHHDESD